MMRTTKFIPRTVTCVRSLVNHRAFRIEYIPQPTQRAFHALRTSKSSRLLLCPRISTHEFLQSRSESSSAAASPPNTSTNAPESRLDRDQVPSYEITFTCKICKTRSSHRLSKQGYHHGTVLISCPDCKNRHLISDHLKIFSDKSVTIEDLMREKGSLVKKGSLSADGDLEFWDDGSSTPRSAHFHPESTPKGENRFVEQPKPPAAENS